MREVKNEWHELAHYKLYDGSTLTITRRVDKYEVACYSASDIELWSKTFDNEDDAWEHYAKEKYK